MMVAARSTFFFLSPYDQGPNINNLKGWDLHFL